VQLTRLYIRFFRSFNFDYERKAHTGGRAHEWEMIDGSWFPFISVALDPVMTGVVGANESGKSHLIAAARQALTGEDISRRDFCRFSTLYSVEAGRVRTPDFGVGLQLDEEDAALLAAVDIEINPGDLVTFLRFGSGTTALVLPDNSALDLTDDQLEAIESRLPRPFELDADVPLPDSITLDEILERSPQWAMGRRDRARLRTTLGQLVENTVEAVNTSAPAIASSLRPYDDDPTRLKAVDLARKLLVDVAQIDRSAFEDLETALEQGEEGQVGGLLETMNRALARHLNFSRWWRQDRDFELRLSPRDSEVVFTIRDRTGTDYSFQDRSRGLRFFLGYYVQLLAHDRSASRPEILLMDEPDAYLSSVAQQDLLRVLENFAVPDDRSRRDQVIYVTHSPFLIDKNAAGRLRVLDKGSNEEGTRVVKDAVHNHYEPLRSAIGSFVAETAFLGGANLIVEGPADQVLLAGVNDLLRRRSTAPSQILDLNEVTIVPAGSASFVPYMTYLARGRDELKPACVALLDGDQAGGEAIRQLKRSTDGRRGRVLGDQYIVDLGVWAEDAGLRLESDGPVIEIEDLIPAAVAFRAAREYATRLLGLSAQQAERLTQRKVTEALAGDRVDGMWGALEKAFAEAYEGEHIDKLGFAKELVRYLDGLHLDQQRPTGLNTLETNFALLIAHLSDLLGSASAEETERRTSKRTDEIVASFLRDHRESATRDETAQRLREIDASLEGTLGDDAVARELQAIRRTFGLNTRPLELVDDFGQLAERLRALKVKRRDSYLDPTTVLPA
jgi:hypothetical protein